MRKFVALFAAAAVPVLLFGSSAGADAKLKRLGEDPALDAIPALDLTYLDAGRDGSDLVMRIGVANMLPGIGGYPELPGVEWQFKVGKRVFLAEGVASTEPLFFFFELVDGTYQQIDGLTGTYDFADGYIEMRAALKTIGARRGSVISGVPTDGGGDVDSHVHLGATTYYSDAITTTKKFVVP